MAGLSFSGIAYACGVAAAARAAGFSTADAAERAPAGTFPDVVRESGLPNWPLFEWWQPGGFFEPGEGVMHPPLLAIYGDNTAYADAATRLALPPVWVKTLSDQALQVLNTPADLVWNPDIEPPGDRPIDQMRARTKAGDYLTAHLPGWLEGDEQHAYPPRLRELYQQVKAIRRHVTDTGKPWRPPGVMLGIVSIDYTPDHYRDWPGALPAPSRRLYQEIRLPDGPRGLPRATQKVWPMYRTGKRFVAATWRYLLPHEIT
jgi:hypothetical protein